MTEVSRRRFIAFSAAGASAIAALGLTACGDAMGSAVGGNAAASGDTLVIGADAGATNQFIYNFNANGGNGIGAAPICGLFHETLFRVSAANGGKLEPVLAESMEYSADGMKVTYKLRQGVKWSDGEDFTADDVVYSYNATYGTPIPLDQPDPDNSAFIAKPVYKTDDYTVVVEYRTPSFQQDTNMSLYYPIYPEHIYKSVGERGKYIDKEPVGTGPAKLVKFQTQQIDLELRDDYWGGTFEGLKKIKVIPAGTPGNVQSKLTKGEIDWAAGGAPGVETTFVAAADTNQYNYWPDGSARGILFGCTMDATNDIAVRKALRDVLDMDPIQKAAGLGYNVPNTAGLDPVLYKEFLLPDYNTSMKARDAATVKSELEAAGWSVSATGNLSKDGKEYPLKLMVNLSQQVDVVAGPQIAQQWKEKLGLEIPYTGVADKVFQDSIHDYAISIWTCCLNGSPYNAYQGYSHANLGEKQQKAGYGNQGLWRMPDPAEAALQTLQKTPRDDDATIKANILIIQQAFVDEAPIVPIMSGGGGIMSSTKNWTGWPVPGEADYFPRPGDFNNPNQTVLKLKHV
ncbi:ABC transporter substrate-binding protein [Micrococcales bacterium 31B]|nr:ABC transporter substrate-binding protein [Micrococcales bacterium 31B]